MTRYTLFAARDGDVFRDQTDAVGEEEARTWAADRIVRTFELEVTSHGFDEVVAECDGVWLEPEDDPLDDFAVHWAIAQTRILSGFEKHYGVRYKLERSQCLYALVDFLNAVRP